MEYLISLIFVILAFFAIYKARLFALEGVKKHWLAGAFAFKLLLAVAMLLLYSRSPEIKDKADIFRFFEDASVIHNTLKTDPEAYFKMVTGLNADDQDLYQYYLQTNNWEYSNQSKLFSNNRLIIRYMAVASIFTLGTYGGILVLSCFLAFLGLFWIYRFSITLLNQNKIFLFALIFLTPSIAFWTSGILKEALLVFAIGAVLNFGDKALGGKNLALNSSLFIFALASVFHLKAFALFILLPSIFGYLWNHYFPRQRVFIPYFIGLFVTFSIASESHKFMGVGFFDLLIEKQLAFTELAIQEDAESSIAAIQFQSNSVSIASNSPIALINTLFRPMLWEAKNTLMLFASLENLVLLLGIFLVIFAPNKKLENPNFFLFCLSLSLCYFIIIGLSSPVLGALSRYRVPALIFFELGIIQLVDLNRLGLLKKK